MRKFGSQLSLKRHKAFKGRVLDEIIGNVSVECRFKMDKDVLGSFLMIEFDTILQRKNCKSIKMFLLARNSYLLRFLSFLIKKHRMTFE